MNGTAPDHPFAQCLQRLERLPDSGRYLPALAQRYSYVVPDEPLLEVLGTLAPLVEIGAGTGYWAFMLRNRAADIVAFDQAPPGGGRVNRYHGDVPTWTDVLAGEAQVLTGYSDRTLFLCWPPLFSSLGDCLSFYAGDTIALIGDGGHRTASIRGLTDSFAIVAHLPARALEPSPGVQPALSVWRRPAKGPAAR